MTGLQFGGSSASSTAQQVRLVQLVLDASKVRNANAAAAVVANSGAISGEFYLKLSLPYFQSAFDLMMILKDYSYADEVDGAAESDTTCTLCGRKCSDRQNFNAHIRMHLKEKLNIRREQVIQSLKLPYKLNLYAVFLCAILRI